MNQLPGLKTLEEVAIFPMLRCATILLDKPLYLVESGDNAFLARGAATLLFGFREVVEFGAQIVEVDVSVGKFEPAQRVGQTAEGCDFLELTKVVNQPIRQPGQSQGLG
jgi:hypothetical protein